MSAPSTTSTAAAPTRVNGTLFNYAFAQRPAGDHPTSGWQTEPVFPPRSQAPYGSWRPPAADDSLSTLLAVNLDFQQGTPAAVWRLHADGSSPQKLYDVAAGDYGSTYVFSDDGSRALILLKGSFDPAHPTPPGLDELYDVSSGTPQLANLLPGDVAPSCQFPTNNSHRVFSGPADDWIDHTSHWVSADGQRLYFNGCGAVPHLYMRDFDAATTTRIDGPPISGPDCAGALIRSTPTAVYFWTQSRLDPADTNPAACDDDLTSSSVPDGDVYRYELADQTYKCLTCAVAGLDADVDLGHASTVGPGLAAAATIAVSADGSRVYFKTKAHLLPGANPSGQLGAYRVDDQGHLAYIGPLDTAAVLGNNPNDGSATSPDGSALLFRSAEPGLDSLTDSDNGGSAQYYLYRDADRSLICISCPADGSPPRAAASRGIGGFFGEPGPNLTPLSEDGSVVAFATPTALVAADQNTAAPADNPAGGTDVYEFRDGRPLLVSDGATAWTVKDTPSASDDVPQVQAVSRSGNDAFFIAPAQYTQDALDSYDRLYDARIGGGIDFPPAVLPPCDLNSDACEGPGSSAPDQPGSGAAAFSGQGNAGRDRTPKQEEAQKAPQAQEAQAQGKAPPKGKPMSPRRIAPLIALAALGLLGGAEAPAATAAPAWNLAIHHNETNFVPGSGGAGATVTTLTNGQAPATNEVQQLIVKASSGKFNLTFASSTTPDLPFNAAAADVQAALQPLVGSGNVSVSGGPGDLAGSAPYLITFTGALAGTDVAQITAASGTGFLAGGPQFWFDIDNVGDAATSGPITFTINLPSGLSRDQVHINDFEVNSIAPMLPWSCPGSPGAHTITCTTSGSLPRHTLTYFVLNVNVTATSGERTITATLAGGGAPDAPAADGCAPGIGACASETAQIDASPPGFGILADSFTPDFTDLDGVTPVRQAGGHPALFSVPVDFNSVDAGQTYGSSPPIKRADESLRDLTVDLPPGFIGDPTAVGECTPAELSGQVCPSDSQVGRFDGAVYPYAVAIWHLSEPVFNMTHPVGVVNDLAFIVAGNPVHVRVSLDPARNYAIRSKLLAVNESAPAYNGTVTLWGYPKDPAHDSEHCGGEHVDTSSTCPSDGPDKAFLTTPFQCGVDMGITARDYDSWQNPGVFGAPITHDLGTFSGCDQVPFNPTVTVAPTNDTADSPSGLDVGINLPQDNDPTHIATSPLKDATVTLPQGLTVNPAAANGLSACTPAQISLGTDDPVKCPDASKIADAEVITPAIPEPIEGLVYLAAQDDNPFDSLLAGYIVFSDPDRGILIKVPGEISVDKDTGQITGTFKDNPQLPFSNLTLHFKAGAHAALITPKTCGDYTSSSELSGWAGNPPTDGTDTFTITQSPGGGACPAKESDQPNTPSLDAGPVSPISAHYSPFVLHLRRDDGTQTFSALNLTLPQGMTGKLAGTALCPDADLIAAQSKSGVEEQADPSCPLDSHVGEVVAGAGAGPSPYYAKGDAYLAGPYKGAPVSLATIVPAVAGPFDLGTIVVRAPLFIDPTTAQISAKTDPIPTALQGIPTDVRSVDVIMDRPDFTLTGTSCDPASVDGLLTSTLGQTAPLSVRYQLSDCGRLGFKPSFKLGLKGGTHRNGHPAFKTTIAYPSGDYANLSYAQVTLPKQIQLDQSHIQAPCTRPQFAAGQCPAASIIGTAIATSPLIDYPLTGPVYLRTGSNPLPDVVLALHGPPSQPIEIDQVGKVDTKNARLRTTFETIPDAPLSSAVVSLVGGSKGLLVNNSSLCPGPDIASLHLAAHDGDFMHLSPKVSVAGCPKAHKKKHHKRHKRHHTRHRGSK